MLPKRLLAIYTNLKQNKSALSEEQSILLQELSFIDNNQKIEEEFKNFVFKATLKESFSAATGYCPACGKKI